VLRWTAVFKTEVWGILERCWKPTPGDRPRIKDVLQCLNDASMSWAPPSPQAVASRPTIDPPARILESSAEESTDESEMSPPPQGVSSHPPRQHSKGDLNDNRIQPSAHEFSALHHDTPARPGDRASAESPGGSDAEASAGILDRVSYAGLLDGSRC